MTNFAEAYKHVMSLYESGDLSHDQATPILEALEAAHELEQSHDKFLLIYHETRELVKLEDIASRIVQQKESIRQIVRRAERDIATGHPTLKDLYDGLKPAEPVAK